VQLAQLAVSAAAAPPGHRRGYEGYRRYLGSERDHLRGALIEALSSPRYFTLLVSLERFAASRPRGLRSATDNDALEPAAAAGRRALKQAFRRLRKRAQRVRAAPTPEDLHTLRIRAKRVRYLLEFLTDLTGKPGARLVRRLVELQDLLGAYHDAVVTADTVRRYVEGPGSEQTPAALLALGTLVSQHLHAAEAKRARFDRTWSRFVRPRNRRLLKGVLRRLKDEARSARRARPDPSAAVASTAPPLPPASPKQAVA
jgi:CHAD domain-containing protein